MEYERIDKPRTGMISPSKLRMKLMGPHHQRKKDGSGSNSSRTSPSKLQDSGFVKNSLLASKSEVYDEQVSSVQSSVKLCHQAVSFPMQNETFCLKENGDVGRLKVQMNSSTVHTTKSQDDENLDYDSNASSSSFEFHKGERVVPKSLTRSLSRPTSYKWNDAEKWIMNKQIAQTNHLKGHIVQNQVYRMPLMNMARVAPEAVASYDHRLAARTADTKRVDFCQPAGQTGLEKFSFDHPVAQDSLLQSNDDASVSVDLYPQSKDLKEVDQMNVAEDAAGTPAIRAVSMRDMGTEMTPVPSQEPSRTATPVGATTPFRSPSSSMPSTPRRGMLSSNATDHAIDGSYNSTENSKRELSEQELKLKTRREIVALGVQLGKMNIAAWASKDEKEMSHWPAETTDPHEIDRVEFQKRAAAWEEAENSKHAARFKREEIRIQAWESHQKAKLEAEMKRMEAKIDQMRASAEVKMMKKIAIARKKSEEKRAAAEAKRNSQAERTAEQVDYIRQTGRMLSSHSICCGLFL